MVNVAIKEEELRQFVEQIVREALKRDGTRRANPAPQLATEPTGRDAEESHEIWCDGFMRVTRGRQVHGTQSHEGVLDDG